MAGPNGREIGRLSVRIVPDVDASKFHKSVKDQLKNVDDAEVGVKLRTDVRGFIGDLQKSIKDLSSKIADNESLRVRVGVQVTQKEVQRAATDVAKRMEDNLARKTIDFKGGINAPMVNVQVNKGSLLAARLFIREFFESRPVDVMINVNVRPAHLLKAEAQLKELTRPRKVNLEPGNLPLIGKSLREVFEFLSGTGNTSAALRSMQELVWEMDSYAPSVAAAALATAGFAAALLSTAGLAATMAMDLASIGTVALTLPGIFGGLAIGLGTTIAAFADFNTHVPQLGTAMKALQDSLSANFWEQAAVPINNLVNSLLPAFVAGVNGAATQIGSFFGSFATALEGAFGPIMNSMFANLSASIANFSSAAEPLANIIATLADTGARQLPQLAAFMASLVTQFDAFLTKAASDGSLDRWIANGIENLGYLVSSMISIGSIFASVAEAAANAGYGGMETFAGALRNIANIAASPGFQTGLTTAFKAAGDAMANMATAIGPTFSTFLATIATLMGQVLPQAGTTLGTVFASVFKVLSDQAVTSAVVAMFSTIATVVTNLSSPAVLGALGLALGGVMTVLNAFIASLSGFGPMIQWLSGIITGVAEPLAGLIGLLGTLVQGAFTSMIEPITAFGTLLGSIIEQLSGIFAPLIEQVLAVVEQMSPVITGIITALGPLVDAILPILGTLLGIVVGVAIAVGQAFAEKLGPAIKRVITAITPFVEALMHVVNFVAPAVIAVLGFVVDILVGMLADAITGIAKIFEGVLDIIMGLWEVFAGIFTGDWDRAWQGIKRVFDGIWQVLLGALMVVINTFGGIFGRGVTLLKTLWQGGWKGIATFFKTTGDNILNGLKSWGNGLKTTFNNVKDWIVDTWKAGWNLVKSFASSVWTSIKTIVKTAVQTMVDNVATTMGVVVQTVKEIWTRVTDYFEGIDLVQIGRDMIQGLINGVAGMAGALAAKAREIGNSALDAIKGALGIHSPSREFKSVGQFAMQGLLNGLESQYQTVRGSLSGFADDLSRDMSQTDLTTSFTGNFSGQLGETVGGGTKTFNYYAAPGSSISSEEDLFAATSRGRMVGF